MVMDTVNSQWKKVYTRQPHTNDVFALATIGTKVVSGGRILATAAVSYLIHISSLGIDNKLVFIEPQPQDSTFEVVTCARSAPCQGINISRKRRLVSTAYEDHVSIWEMGESEKVHDYSSMMTESHLPIMSSPSCLMSIQLKVIKTFFRIKDLLVTLYRVTFIFSVVLSLRMESCLLSLTWTQPDSFF
jgi:hypothetical protein